MKGSISWLCISCSGSETHDLKIRLIPYDPASSVTIFWSLFLPAKRHINMHTICHTCLQKLGGLSYEEQVGMIFKHRDQYLFNQKVAWIRQEWRFWIPNLEYRDIQESVRENQEISLHLFGNAYCRV